MNSFALSVPGNLLLGGEYAVTEEGGLGLTLSPGPRITLSAKPSSRWSLEGVWPGGSDTFIPGQVSTGLLAALWNRIDREGALSAHAPWSLRVDSGNFFDSQGRKRGFGSSAATAALVSSALSYILSEKGIPSSRPHPVQISSLKQEAFLPAVEAHRNFQGGKGSGYDVAASLFGGMGLFTGGAVPRWQPGAFPLPSGLRLTAGPEAVRTVSALGSWRTWKLQDPEAHRAYLEKNNSLIRKMAESGSFDSGLLTEIRELSRSLGRRLGVSADWTLPEGVENLGWKALGAGNEIILLWPLSGEQTVSLGEPLELEKEGLRWEPEQV